MNENTKHQTPNAPEVPMINEQIPKKPQFPSSNGRAAALWVGIWNLGFILSLGIGHW
jgi:hypothetical protein